MAAFDYIIVGAGTAGSLLALRLAEAGRNSVCVVEAGPEDRNPWLRIPAGFLKTLADTRVTWPFTTEPSPGTNGRSLRLPQGKVLGGTSAINGAIYNRGQAEDFDGWAAAGNPGWAYADVLGYFKRTERRIGAADLALRGTRGALPVSTNRLPIPANLAFIRAAEAQGLPLNPDYNGATQFGVAWTQATIERGWRVSAAHAFLHPARKMGVSVRTRHCVSRLLFDGRKAVGVLCRARDGAEVTIHARREVILCAGTVNSPKLLQLSGIGPPALLGRHGILVLLPLVGVGENLQDHYGVRLTARGKRGMDGINARVQGWRLPREVFRWLVGRPSVLGMSPGHLHVFGKTDAEMTRPDYFVVYAPGSYKLGVIGRLDDYPGVSAATCALRPHSRGYVRIGSPDPAAAALIQPNYLADERDVSVTVAALKAVRRIVAAPELAALIECETLPGPAVQSEPDWRDFARAFGSTAFHPVGTCKMGPASDPSAVVDRELRVHGIDGLRVVDASVMPALVSANTAAATLMIAEKAADMVLGQTPAATNIRGTGADNGRQ